MSYSKAPGLSVTDDTGNVVDHDAAHVTEEPIRPAHTNHSHSHRIAKQGKQDGLITVEPLKQSEMQPLYAQDLGLGNVTHGIYGTMIQGLGSIIGLCGAIPCPCCVFCPNPYKNVEQGSVGLVSRFGQFYKSVDPGLVNVNPCTETLKKVDVKIQISPIGRQTVITRDNVNVEIDSVIYFQSVVTEREAMAFEIAEIVGDVADKWGVAIEGILIKDIIFSAEVATSLSSAAQQKRIGESKVIAARAEVDSARLMRQAADILASPAAMQIRQLEALQTMAKSSGSKVIFVPMQLQSDVVGQMSRSEAGSDFGSGPVGRAGLLGAMSDS